MTTEPIIPTVENLREQVAEHKCKTMSDARKREILEEVIWADVRHEGVYIKCHGEDMDGRDPYLVHEDDDWLNVMWNDEMHDLNIWLDDKTNKWRWAVYVKDDYSVRVAEGHATPRVDYEGH